MDFFDEYLNYVGRTEAPILYHRWCCISMLGALLCRDVYYPFGHGKIYPNFYVMLMGSPGTRKGTAIGISENLLRATGFNRFAPDRLSKERFLMEMKPRDLDGLDSDLESITLDNPSEIYAIADEFGDFVGQGGMEFMTMLTKLWDNKDRYTHPKIHGKSVEVDRPTVSILAGNTPQGLVLTVPAEALGNGFLSRVIFVHSEPTSIKITFPDPVAQELKLNLLSRLKEIKDLHKGEMTRTSEAAELLERMYKEYRHADDQRFKSYGTRRFTHLLKLCIILAISDGRTDITREDTLNANTLLYYTELRMPKALGEYGKSKNSDANSIILDILNTSHKPLSITELYKIASNDLSMRDLPEIVKGLLVAEKIQVITIKGKQGYMPLHKEVERWDPSLLNESFLKPEELV